MIPILSVVDADASVPLGSCGVATAMDCKPYGFVPCCPRMCVLLSSSSSELEIGTGLLPVDCLYDREMTWSFADGGW